MYVTVPEAIVGTLPPHGVDEIGTNGGGGLLAIRKSAPKLTLSCTVQKPTRTCVPALVLVNSARTLM